MTDGFDGLAGAGGTGAADEAGAMAAARAVPAGVRAVPPPAPAATRLVLIRHGEAVCNVSGVCGGPAGCQGLTALGRRQVEALRDRLFVSRELAGTDALYASVLPRAVETAELVAPALGAVEAGGRLGPPPTLVTDCGLCELHPGEADGLTWIEFGERFAPIDWDEDPGRPIAPGGESWTGFVQRVAAALDALVRRHPGQLVVVACHAGVVEASLLAKLPVAGGLAGARLQLQTRHASMTGWEVSGGRWRLLGYNDAAHQLLTELSPETVAVQQA
ncbi:MAG TPA: histidine phosphatase family protein [Acidimicrobiales bacterium]|nr:histidine phosphatase family protein [Acidimicrobiales bacterium]